MNVFIDTEFTDFTNPYLISLGMASEYGEDFYAEVPYPDHACSEFVREVVVPLLSQTPYAYFTINNLYLEVIKWLEIVRRNNESVYICVDSQTDWDLFSKVLHKRVPAWCHCKLVNNGIVELMLYDFFKNSGLPEHHALHDAQANRHAYRNIYESS